MSETLVQLNEETIKGQIKELAHESIEDMLNNLLQVETEKVDTGQPSMNAARPIMATPATITTQPLEMLHLKSIDLR